MMCYCSDRVGEGASFEELIKCRRAVINESENEHLFGGTSRRSQHGYEEDQGMLSQYVRQESDHEIAFVDVSRRKPEEKQAILDENSRASTHSSRNFSIELGSAGNRDITNKENPNEAPSKNNYANRQGGCRNGPHRSHNRKGHWEILHKN